MRKKIIIGLILILITIGVYYTIQPIRQAYHFNNNSDTSYQYVNLYNDVKLQLKDSLIKLNQLDTFGYFSLNPIWGKPIHWDIDTMVFNNEKNRFFAIIISMYSINDYQANSNFSNFIIGQNDNNKWTFYLMHGLTEQILHSKSYTQEYIQKKARETLLFYYYKPNSLEISPEFWTLCFFDNKKRLVDLNKLWAKQLYNY